MVKQVPLKGSGRPQHGRARMTKARYIGHSLHAEECDPVQHVGHKIKGFYRLADYAPRWGMTTSAMCTGPIHWIDPNRPAALYLLA